ncbi:hypothetical protein [Methylophilus rhizosphaerae]|nr:hypothetical protein [Methylophilus rhizosphaerae]
MKNNSHGASLYYATDKNVFDALNQHKVDLQTIFKLFQRRNIIVSKKTPRDELANYFARLGHDYFDHKDISSRLGITPRRERITSMDIIGQNDIESVKAACSKLQHELEAAGDVVQVTRDGNIFTMNVQYSTIDYKLSEFAQVQVRDGIIEFEKTADGYIVRNTHNDYLNNVRDSILGNLDKDTTQPLERKAVSLFDITSPKLRSKFFHDLVSSLPGFTRKDVTDVFVYKAMPELEEGDESEDETTDSDTDNHVERVALRGFGVTRSEILNRLLDNNLYYITKIGWTTQENTGVGNVYDIEAVFSDPKDCTGFSFILSGVYPFEDGALSTRRRGPTKQEIDSISRVVEAKARALVIELRQQFQMQSTTVTE